MRSIIEPFRIKSTESLSITTVLERKKLLQQAHQNVFLLPAEKVTIDLLTDSGTGAMSTEQWAALMLGDESYAGSRSWNKFEQRIQEITGMPFVFPTHQGRAAENILAKIRINPGDIIPNNSHFDTTRANFEYAGAEALNLLCAEGYDLSSEAFFKGNMDLERLRQCLEEFGADKIPFVMVTITNNAGGGQPVSLGNIKAIKQMLQEFEIPLIIDACRFAENAYFIKRYESGYEQSTLLEIAQEIFNLADGATMSLKKDGLANIGGFFVCRDPKWAEDFKNLLILQEGFPTYGGLAGRDLEVAAVGLKEVLEMDYQIYRHATVEYVHRKLAASEIPLVNPAGGHAVFIDAGAFLPHIHPSQFPGIALTNALYEIAGVRVVELGSLMFGKTDQDNEKTAPHELVRMAFPRRVYTQSHFDYLVEAIELCWQRKDSLSGYRITKQPKYLRHFSSHLEKL